MFSLVLISLLSFATLAQPTTYYVAKTGNDSDDGSSGYPWLTVQKAADTLTAGQTCYIKAGTYNEHITIANSGSSGNFIVFENYQTDAVKISSFNIPSGKNYVKIKGFEIGDYGGGNPYNGIRSETNSSYCEIRDNTIHDVRQGIWMRGNYHLVNGNTFYSCGYPGGGNHIFLSGTDNIIEYNDFSDPYQKTTDFITYCNSNQIIRYNTFHTLVEFGPHNDVLVTYGADNVLIEGNHFYDLGNVQCWFCEPQSPGLIHDITYKNNIIEHRPGLTQTQSINIMGANNVTFENNTFYDIPGGIAVRAWGGNPSTNTVIKNNIFYECSYWADGGSVVNADYNCIYPGSNSEAHGIAADPKFVDAANHDFRLQADSPCKGTGEGGVDMGAYGAAEYDPVYEDPIEPDPPSENPAETDSPSDGVDRVLNRPNPFRAGKEESLIEYNLKQPSNVTITIYNLLGQEVWQENYRSGENGGKEDNSIPWNGRNLSGEVVGNGGYICRIWIEREKRHIVRKIAVVK